MRSGFFVKGVGMVPRPWHDLVITAVGTNACSFASNDFWLPGATPLFVRHMIHEVPQVLHILYGVLLEVFQILIGRQNFLEVSVGSHAVPTSSVPTAALPARVKPSYCILWCVRVGRVFA